MLDQDLHNSLLAIDNKIYEASLLDNIMDQRNEYENIMGLLYKNFREIGNGCYSRVFSLDNLDYVIKTCIPDAEKSMTYRRQAFWEKHIDDILPAQFIYPNYYVMVQQKGKPVRPHPDYINLIYEKAKEYVKKYCKDFCYFCHNDYEIYDYMYVNLVDVHFNQFVSINEQIKLIDL